MHEKTGSGSVVAGAETWSIGSRPTSAVAVLGAVRVRAGERVLGPRDFGGIKPKQLFELLVLARGRPVPKDRLADELWGDALPQNVSGTLESYVSIMRRRLGPDKLVETTPGGYRFVIEHADVDLDRFDDLVRRAAGAGPRAARRHLEQAIALVRGDVVEDEPYASWAETERLVYRGRVVQAHLDAAEAALACRDGNAAVALAERALERDPLSEQAYRTLMLASYAVGRQDGALRAFDRCQRMLADELGVAPMQETRTLFLRIHAQAPLAELLPAPAWDGLPAAIDLQAPRVPLVGRGQELDALASAVTGSLGGAYALVMVEAGAGMGKSRLLDEVVARLGEGREAGSGGVGEAGAVRVGRARCSSLERELPLVPLAMALRSALPADAPDPLARVLSELSPEAGEAGRIRALEVLAELAGGNGPTVLVLDELHWADPSTITALCYLRHRCARARLAVVAAVDPGQVGPGHPVSWLEPDVRLRLGPLSRSVVDALGRPGLYERTGGHPLLTAECLEAEANGRADDVLIALGPWVLEQSQSAGPLAHRLLVTAAVLGRPFCPEELTSVVDGPPAELAAELDRLCERGLLRVEGAGFDFRFELVREVLANSVSPARRRLVRDRLLDPVLAPAV